MAIFINYRREDSEGYARSLRERLIEDTDAADVFLDFDEIPGGENWRQRIDQVLANAQAIIVVIGPRWLEILNARAASGNADTVCKEIAAGLGKPGVRVIPVLVGGARFPDAGTLPESIRGLADLNAIDLRGATWNADVRRLVDALRRTGALRTSKRRRVAYALVAGVAAIALSAGLFGLRVEVPALPKNMSYRQAKLAVEGRGLRLTAHLEPSHPGVPVGIDAVAEQRPAGGASLFRGQSVDVQLVRVEAYVLVCRGGGSFNNLPGEDGFTLKVYQDKASRSMDEGSCAWLDRPLNPQEAQFIKPLGFGDDVPEMFLRAPERLLAFCAISEYSADLSRSPRLVGLSVRNYLQNDGNGRLTEAIDSQTCVDHAE